MKDLKAFNAASLEAMDLIVSHMPDDQKKLIEKAMHEGASLKLSTIAGADPDVQLSLINAAGDEMLIYSLVGKIGEEIH